MEEQLKLYNKRPCEVTFAALDLGHQSYADVVN